MPFVFDTARYYCFVVNTNVFYVVVRMPGITRKRLMSPESRSQRPHVCSDSGDVWWHFWMDWKGSGLAPI